MPNEIEDLVQKRQNLRQAKKKNQIPYAIVMLLFAIIVSAFLWNFQKRYLVFWVIGIAFGIVLRYSRFCFAATFRDPFLMKNTKLMRALLLSLIVSTVGFAIIQYRYLISHSTLNYEDLPGRLNPVGLQIAVGAVLFGIGMVIAGGCASSVLMRIGEGHILPWVTLLGFFIGTTLGAKDYPFWYEKIIKTTKIIYFPEYLNIGVVVVIQIAVLIGLYKFAAWYQNRETKDGGTGGHANGD